MFAGLYNNCGYDLWNGWTIRFYQVRTVVSGSIMHSSWCIHMFYLHSLIREITVFMGLNPFSSLFSIFQKRRVCHLFNFQVDCYQTLQAEIAFVNLKLRHLYNEKISNFNGFARLQYKHTIDLFKAYGWLVNFNGSRAARVLLACHLFLFLSN